VTGIEPQDSNAGGVRDVDELPATIKVDLRRAVVASDAQVTFVACAPRSSTADVESNAKTSRWLPSTMVTRPENCSDTT
jgi:hypothetical protein